MFSKTNTQQRRLVYFLAIVVHSVCAVLLIIITIIIMINNLIYEREFLSLSLARTFIIAHVWTRGRDGVRDFRHNFQLKRLKGITYHTNTWLSRGNIYPKKIFLRSAVRCKIDNERVFSLFRIQITLWPPGKSASVWENLIQISSVMQ